MDLKAWTPFPYLDADWHIDFPRIVREPYPFRPSIDVVKTDGQLVMTAELPGMTVDEVDVSLDGEILTVKGEKSDETKTEEANRYIHERIFGSFQRKITVPTGVTPEDIEAVFENGVLTVQVELPDEETLEPQHIPVTAKNGS